MKNEKLAFTKLGEQGYYSARGEYKINTYRLLINKQLVEQLGWKSGCDLCLTIVDGKLVVDEIKKTT